MADILNTIVGIVFTIANWNYAPWIWLSLLFIGLVVAPFIAFHRVRVERDALIEKAKPKLMVIDKNEENIDFSNAGSEYSLGLQIKNLGTEQAKICQGVLVNVCFAGCRNNNYTLDTQPKNRPLMWTGENRDESIGCIVIEGNTSAILEIATCKSHSGLNLSYAGSRDSRNKLEIKLPYSVLAIISITSEGATPIYAVCFLKKAVYFYDIELLSVVDDLPDINHYCSLIDDREGSQNQCV